MKLIYELAPIVAIGLNFFLIFLVLRQIRRSHLHRVFAFFLFSMLLWAITIYGMSIFPTMEQALLWEKAVIIALGLVAVSFYHFVLVFTKGKIGSWRLPLTHFNVGSLELLIAYLSLFIFICLTPTNLLVDRMKFMWYGFGFEPGPLLLPYLVIYYGFAILSIILLIRAYQRTESALARKSYLYIAIGAVICLLGVLSDLLAVGGVPIYPMGIPSNIIFAFMCTYAILRFQLLDVSVVVRKGTAYVLVYAMGTAMYVGLVFLGYIAITRTWSLVDWLSIFFLFIITVGLHPVLRRIQSLVDRWFYRERYDYLRALEGLAQEFKDITELAVIAERLVDAVMAAMKCRSIAVLLPDAEDNYFVPVAGRGIGSHSSIRLYRQSALAMGLNKRGEPATRQDVSILPQFQAITATEKAMLSGLDAELFIPLMTREGLRGILILGPSFSEQEYSAEDVRLLKVVAYQMANTLDNARLYDLQTRRYHEQALLARLAQIVASEFDLQKMCSLALDELRKVIPFDYSSVMLNDEKGKPSLAAFTWTRETSQELDHKPDSAHNGGRATDETACAMHFESMLRLSLYSEGRSIGEFVLASQEPDMYNESNLKLLQQVSIQLAIGIDKAQLYQSEREAREELQKQYSERTDFINALVHEIKTPMTAIITSAELLSEELATDSPTISDLAENLDISAHNLDRRISELMDFVKLQLPDFKLNMQFVDFRLLAESVVSQLTGLFRSKNQALHLELPHYLGQVKADPERLTQVLLNLLTNASKFSSTNTVIYLRAYTYDSTIIVEIHDSAPPIKPQEAALLFSRYYRGNQKGGGGLGLGLFICKKLVELHGGKIWVETEENGNIFKFSLPIDDAAEVKHESSAN